MTGGIAYKLVQSHPLEDTRTYFTRMVRRMHLKPYDIVLISVCAGVGEELLFRASVQPLLGIWITAIIFVALHGYLNPKNLSLTLYGIYMIFLSAGLGYLFEYVGIYSAMAAHFIVDVILLAELLRAVKSPRHR